MKPPARLLSRLVVPVLIGLLSAACGRVDDAPKIDPQRLLGELGGETPPLLLDVRSLREFRGGHIPGAVNVPVRDLGRWLSRLERYREQPVVVYCETGVRSRHAVGRLQEAGFGQVLQLDGDMRVWRSRGLPQSKQG